MARVIKSVKPVKLANFNLRFSGVHVIKVNDPGIPYTPIVSGDTIETPGGLDIETPDGDTIEVP